MLWHRQAIFKSKGDNLSSSAEFRIRTQRVSETKSSADWMPADKPTELSRIKLKTWTWKPVPMISKHSAYLNPLPFGIRTWLWRYTYLLLLISMLWHRQEIFESKGDNLYSSAECRIRTQRVSGTKSSAEFRCTGIHAYIRTCMHARTHTHTCIHTYILGFIEFWAFPVHSSMTGLFQSRVMGRYRRRIWSSITVVYISLWK